MSDSTDTDMTLILEFSAIRRLEEPVADINDARRWSEHVGIVSDTSPDGVRAFNDFGATANLNVIAGALGLGFRLNDDQVVDPESNSGRFSILATGNLVGPDSLFETRVGINDDPDAHTTDYLIERANVASAFARDGLDGENVTLFFDENEPLRDQVRLLAYAEYDADGDGRRETLYNRQIIEEGYGRVYSSGLTKHDEFWAAKRGAREANRGV